MMKMRVIITAVAVSVAAPALAGDLGEAIELTRLANVAAAQTQTKVDKLSNQTEDMLAQYRNAQRQHDSLKVYNDQLQTLVVAQRSELTSLDDQLDRATMIGREVTPLMLRMVEALDQFVALDVPFLLDERRTRVKNLKSLMSKADATDSEKYRLIMEAYQIENEYGRTIEAYQGKLEGGGESAGRTVNFLRIGRVVLVYQTLDGKELGVWNQEAKKWDPLPSEYLSSIQRGIRIAKKQAAPDLLRMPIPAPKPGESSDLSKKEAAK